MFFSKYVLPTCEAQRSSNDYKQLLTYNECKVSVIIKTIIGILRILLSVNIFLILQNIVTSLTVT